MRLLFLWDSFLFEKLIESMAVFVFVLSCSLMAFMFGLFIGQRGREAVELCYQDLLQGISEVLLNAEYISNQTKLTFIFELRPYVSDILQEKLSDLERVFDANISAQK